MQQFYSGLATPTTVATKDSEEPRTKWAKPQGKGPQVGQQLEMGEDGCPQPEGVRSAEGLGRVDGASGDQARGRILDEEDRKRFSPPPRHSGGRHPQPFLGRVSEMAQDEDRGHSDSVPAPNVVVDHKIQQGHSGPRQAGPDGEDGLGRKGRQRSILEVLKMESGKREARAGSRDNRNPSPRSRETPAGSQHGPGDTRCHTSLPWDATLGGNISIPVPSIPLECGMPLRRGTHRAQGHDPTERVGPHKVGGNDSSPATRGPPALVESFGGTSTQTNAGQSGLDGRLNEIPLGAGQSGLDGRLSEIPLGAPATPILTNPGQLCYANAVTLLLKWLLYKYGHRPAPYGQLQTAFTSLKTGQRAPGFT